ncbi:MAG: sulfurtransferase [Synergistaceae bacterium]|nr:sulfurtransferase [Synergistaceae bacterium]
MASKLIVDSCSCGISERDGSMRKFVTTALMGSMLLIFSSMAVAVESSVSPDKTVTPASTSALPAAEIHTVIRPIKPTPMAPGIPETKATLLVSPEWLKKNRANVIIVDARPESLYAGGHIPGAVNATWTYFANMGAPNGSIKWGTVWPSATMAKRIGALGINGKKTVIAYDDAGGWGQSGWVLCILRMSGIKNARILEGGFTAWKQAGGTVSKTNHKNKSVAFSIPKYQATYMVDTKWIDDNLGKEGLVILDVRTPAEYQGKIRPFQEKRAGHLPGAINIELQDFVKDNYDFKEAEEIKVLLEKACITPDNEIVVYDTAGVRAAFVTMVLRYAGYHKSRCYDEGFQAWAGNPKLPLEKSE